MSNERIIKQTNIVLFHDQYSEIWDLDEKDPFTKPEEGGESVADVVSRLTNALITVESEFQG